MSELTPYTGGAQGQALAVIGWAQAADAAYSLAQKLCVTELVPKHYRGKPDEAAAAILFGAELGLDPLASLNSLYIVGGAVGLSATAQVALVRSHRHRIWTEEVSDDRVVVAGQRADDPEHVERVEFTIARARRAGFIKRGQNGAPSNYETQPQVMLWARAATELCRRLDPGALLGLSGDLAEEATAVPLSAPTVVQRRPVGDVAGGSPEPLRPAPRLASQPQGPGPGVGDPPTTPEPKVAEVELPDLTDAQELPLEAEPMLEGAQRARIQAELRAFGIVDHDERVALLSRVLEREITSTNDLTVTEASHVLDHFEWARNTGGRP